MNNILIDPIEELIERYRKEGKIIPIDIKKRNEEIAKINQYMREMDYTNFKDDDFEDDLNDDELLKIDLKDIQEILGQDWNSEEDEVWDDI